MSELTVCPTRAGKGYKAVVNGVWFYTSRAEFLNMVNGNATAAKFRSMDEWKRGEA